MRQVTRKGLITMAAAGSAMALGGYAHADSGAYGGASNSPGVASGNSVQVPVSVPVNACGNSVDVVGALNPTFGNNCANASSVSRPGNPPQPVTPGPKPAEPANPAEPAKPAPGNPAGPSEPRNVPPDTSGTQSGPKTPGERGTTSRTDGPAPRTVAQDDDGGALAETGVGTLGAVIPAGAAMLLGGAVLYRRARAA